MTFTPGCPFDGQSLGASKPQVRGNFTNYLNLVSQDHIGPNLTGQGKHNQSTYVAQSQSPATLTNEIKVYSRTINSIVEWCLQRSGQMTGADDIQLSSGTPGQGTTANFGQSWLPGGFQIKWGQQPNSGSNSVVYESGAVGLTNFPNNTITVFTQILATSLGVSTASNLSSTGFTLFSNVNATLCWVAIGY